LRTGFGILFLKKRSIRRCRFVTCGIGSGHLHSSIAAPFLPPFLNVFSGNSPGIQREANAAGKTSRSEARAVRSEHTPFDQCRDGAAGMAFARAHRAGGWTVPFGHTSLKFCAGTSKT
jgi:hypothetical protein